MAKKNHCPCVGKAEVVDLPRIQDPRGSLTFVEAVHVPFEIKRVYYLYDVPSGEARGGHAHLKLQQLIVAVSGSFDVVIDDGLNRQTVTMNRPYQGLLIRSLIWRELCNFSSGAVCLVLASIEYDEEDYIRDYQRFLSMTKQIRLP